jgi:transposase-like protein
MSELEAGPAAIPPRGYSKRTIRMNRRANNQSLGVQLGRYCMAKDVPVSDVAEFFGVSRQTVYNWFVNKHEAGEPYATKIRNFLDRVR